MSDLRRMLYSDVHLIRPNFQTLTEAENLLTFGNLRTILYLGSTLGKALGPISLHTFQQYGISALETIKKLDIELHKSQ